MRHVICSAIACIFVIAFQEDLKAQVNVKGTTLLANSEGRYRELPSVQIIAYREGPIHPGGVLSDERGAFSFPVPGGLPFRVAFFLDENHVPEVQSLAGKDALTHDLHVALLTVDDYLRLQQQGRIPLPPLRENLQRQLREVRGQDRHIETYKGTLTKILEELTKRGR